MTETKAIGLTAEPVIYHLRCIEMRCTSGIHDRGSPVCICTGRVQDTFTFLCRLLLNQPMMNQENNGSVHECVGCICVEVRMGKEGRSELNCNLSLNHIPSQGGKSPLPGVRQWIKPRCGPHFSKVTFPFDSVSGSLALAVESERWN